MVRIVEEKPEKPIVPFETKHYIKGGANNNYMGTPEYIGSDHGLYTLLGYPEELMGLHLMYGLERPFAQTRWTCMYWGIEAGGTMAAFSINDGHSLFQHCDWQGKIWPEYGDICRFGLQFAPKIGYKVGTRSKKISVSFEAGIYANYNLGSTYTPIDDMMTSEESETSDLLMDALFNEWNNLETGAFVGSGCWLGPIYLGFRFSFGLPSFTNKEIIELIENYYMPAGPFAHENVYMSIGVAF